MNKLTTTEIRDAINDIKASILIDLADNGPTSITALTDNFKSSGYETRRVWVVTAMNELATEGKVAKSGRRWALATMEVVS